MLLLMIVMVMMMMGNRPCVYSLKACDKRVLRIRHVSSGIRRLVIGWAVSYVLRD